jgi:hypothetical protein
MGGVRYRAGGAATHSLVMRSRSGTIRTIESEHQLWKLRAYSSVNFDSPCRAPHLPRLQDRGTAGCPGAVCRPGRRGAVADGLILWQCGLRRGQRVGAAGSARLMGSGRRPW